MKVFNDQHNPFSFTCCNFPAAILVRRVTPWIVRTSKNSWCLIQGCHIGTDCKPYKWTDRKYPGQLELYHFQKRIYLKWQGNRSKPNAGFINLGMRQTLFNLCVCVWKNFSLIIEIILWTSHKQLTAFLRSMFLRVRSIIQTNMSILVGIRRLRLLWHEDLFCCSGCLSLLWKPMWTTATLGKFTNNSTWPMWNMFVGTCKDYFCW